MVVDRGVDEVPDDVADRLFHALADATRRDILRRSVPGGLSVSALARAYDMSLPAVQKHVTVLERAELVTKERRGREQLVRSRVDSVRRAARLLDELEARWRTRVDRVAELLDEAAEPTKGPHRT